MLQFTTIKSSQLPLPKTRCAKVGEEKSLADKFQEKKREIFVREKRKLKEFHFVTIEHESLLHVMNGLGKVLAKLENPNSIKTKRLARNIYVDAIREAKEHHGGCYFN